MTSQNYNLFPNKKQDESSNHSSNQTIKENSSGRLRFACKMLGKGSKHILPSGCLMVMNPTVDIPKIPLNKREGKHNHSPAASNGLGSQQPNGWDCPWSLLVAKYVFSKQWCGVVNFLFLEKTYSHTILFFSKWEACAVSKE